jgi:hypothetical protein
MTIHEAGKGDQSTSDSEVLAIATAQNMAVLTMNRRHFIRLHASSPDHAGIVVCTFDPNFAALGKRIHAAIEVESRLARNLLRINRPP